MPHRQKRKSKGGLIAAIVCGVVAAGAVSGWALSSFQTSAIPRGDIKQGGRVVGVGLNATMPSADQIEFAEIINATDMNQAKEFEYNGRTWKLVQVREFIRTSPTRPGVSMVRALAKMTPGQ